MTRTAHSLIIDLIDAGKWILSSSFAIIGHGLAILGGLVIESFEIAYEVDLSDSDAQDDQMPSRTPKVRETVSPSPANGIVARG